MNEMYKAAGVDIEKGYEAVQLMRADVQRTFNAHVLNGLGGFGGLFELPRGYEQPVLVSGTDGVGTKLKIAFALDKHDTIGQDCVAMCVNDIVCSGAKPLYFLDYVAVDKVIPDKVAQIVGGIARACAACGVALIGGETAEMPSMYAVNEYDLAGFAVGIVEKSRIIDGKNLKKGDVLIGCASTGLHSNGFSLVRKLCSASSYSNYLDELGCTIGEELLKPTRVYANDVMALIGKVDVKAISHITGGGFYENIPRMLSSNTHAKLDVSSIPVPPIFSILQRLGQIPKEQMYNTFNMGIGLICAVSRDEVDRALEILDGAYILGEIVEVECGVTL